VVLTRKADEDVADAIELTLFCQEFHCLPGAGGLYDQDSYDIWRMGLVMDAQAERAEREKEG
jgi:hypothetical protein